MQRFNIMAGLVAFAVAIVFATYSDAQPLKRYKWRNRPLVVFTGDKASADFVAQKRIINAHIAGLRERDMIVIEVVGNDVATRLGAGARVTAGALRRYYGVKQSQFRAILIGKDGGSKLQSSKPIHADRLFSLIDSMPMRRQEVRNQSQ